MTSARGRLFAAIIARLDGICGVELTPSGDPATLPALEVYDGGQRVVEAEAGTTRYDLTATIEGYVDGANGADAHARLNDLHAAVIGLMLAEPPLGGLAETIEEGDLRVTNAPLAALARQGFAQDFLIQYAIPRGDAG